MHDLFRLRGLWWTTLMYVPTTLCKAIGMSALYVKIMECFWGGGTPHAQIGHSSFCGLWLEAHSPEIRFLHK
eukprot:9676229-Lingulodinium_polyedra.AAC.1